MYSNEELERFYFRYQTEALRHETSLQTFCLENKVPYNIFSKFEVQVQGRHIAQRTVRCMTTARNNSLRYGSDVGAEMTATYHSIISTVKLHGKSVWNYHGEFFKNIFEGCGDFSTLKPSVLV